MTKNKLNIIKKVLRRTLWLLLGLGTFVLLGAAMNKKSQLLCKKIDINISGVHNNVFIDEKDVNRILHIINDDELIGRPVSSFDLATMKETLEKNEWIKKAELFFDNNEILYVNIQEREPVARIFTTSGNTYYIDSAAIHIPLSEKFSARLPIYTNYNDSTATREDSLLLLQIRDMSQFILKDSFWMAQIDQIDISKDRTLAIVPKIGNQIILFGTPVNYKDKFHHLYIFYKQVLSKVGWNKYSSISLEYANQIIAVKRGQVEVKMDSIRTAEIMKGILLKTQMQIADTSAIQLTQNDENVQQVIPLINEDALNEDVSSGHPVFDFSRNTTIKMNSDSLLHKRKADSIKAATVLKFKSAPPLQAPVSLKSKPNDVKKKRENKVVKTDY